MHERLPNQIDSKFKIETVEMFDGGSISYCPERGLITSVKIKGQELLYLDEKTLFNKDLKIRGGIPVLFPNAGEISQEQMTSEFSKLKSHGFARDQKWELVETMEGINVSLRSNQETKTVYNYDFLLSLFNKFNKDGSLTITQEVINLEGDKEMPISMGLHPYFKVPHDKKNAIKFNFPGGKKIEKDLNNWANNGTLEINNPGIPLEIDIPDLGILVLDISKEYQKIWIWSEAGEDFICIEPSMRSEGGIVENPQKIKPMGKFSASFNMKLKERVIS